MSLRHPKDSTAEGFDARDEMGGEIVAGRRVIQEIAGAAVGAEERQAGRVAGHAIAGTVEAAAETAAARGARIANEADELLGGAARPQAPAATIAAGALPAAPGTAASVAYRSETSIAELMSDIASEIPAMVRNVPRTEAGLRGMFETQAGYNRVVEFLNRNPEPAQLRRLIGDLTQGGGRIPEARALSAVSNAGAADALAAAAANVTNTTGLVGRVPEMAQFAQTVAKTDGLGASHASAANQLTSAVDTLSRENPEVARRIASIATQTLREHPADFERLVARAQNLVGDNAVRTMTPDAAAAYLAGHGPGTGTIPEALRTSLGPTVGERAATLPQTLRAELARDGDAGWRRLSELTRTNPEIARVTVGELRRTGDVQGTLHAAEWLVGQARANPSILRDTATGSWMRTGVPQMLETAVRNGATPDTVLRQLNSLLEGGLTPAARSDLNYGLAGLQTRMSGKAGNPDFASALSAWRQSHPLR